jgi:hypothetical protein
MTFADIETYGYLFCRNLFVLTYEIDYSRLNIITDIAITDITDIIITDTDITDIVITDITDIVITNITDIVITDIIITDITDIITDITDIVITDNEVFPNGKPCQSTFPNISIIISTFAEIL